MENNSVSDRLKANYDNYYQGESEWRRVGAEDKAANIMHLCSNLPHGTILDIGAGEGAVLKRLSNLCFGNELSALEISNSGIETIRQSCISNLKEVRSFDGYNIPYEDSSFDLAVLSHVVEHLEHPRQLLYEAARVAKCVFIEVPLEHTVRLTYDYELDQLGHINTFSAKTIRRLVQSCDLKIMGQIITNPSHKAYRYQSGHTGSLKYLVKELVLKTTPSLATSIWTYHAALVCTKLMP